MTTSEEGRTEQPVSTDRPAEEPDQDSEPPTWDGKEPDTSQLDPDSEPASDPDPLPGDV